MSRNSFALGSNAVKLTKLPAAAAATSAQVLPANPTRTAVAFLNKTDAIVKIFLGSLADRIALDTHVVELAVGGYYEDPRNFQGDITVEGGTTGTVNCTEWL